MKYRVLHRGAQSSLSTDTISHTGGWSTGFCIGESSPHFLLIPLGWSTTGFCTGESSPHFLLIPSLRCEKSWPWVPTQQKPHMHTHSLHIHYMYTEYTGNRLTVQHKTTQKWENQKNSRVPESDRWHRYIRNPYDTRRAIHNRQQITETRQHTTDKILTFIAKFY